MAGKAERQAARAVVAEYHQAQLAILVSRVAEAIDQHRAGELDPFEVDRVLFQYSRGARELWKFCNYRPIDFTASTIKELAPEDWWEGTAPRER